MDSNRTDLGPSHTSSANLDKCVSMASYKTGQRILIFRGACKA